ncbi:hypothetical protein ACWJJH_21450 [Endozoicomonadaceae bacterium StTr2]
MQYQLMSYQPLKCLFSLFVVQALLKQLILIFFLTLAFSSMAHSTSYLIKKKMGQNKGFQFLGYLQLSRESGEVASVLSLARNQRNSIRIVFSWNAEEEGFGIFDEEFRIHFDGAHTCILQPESHSPLHVFHHMAKSGHSNLSIKAHVEDRLCKFEGVKSENFLFRHGDLGIDSVTASFKSWAENSFTGLCSIRLYEPVSNPKDCCNAEFTLTRAKSWDKKTCFHVVYDRNPCTPLNSVFFIEDINIRMSRVDLLENHGLQVASQIPVTQIIKLSCLLMLLPDVESDGLCALRGQHLQISLKPIPLQSTSEQHTSSVTSASLACSASSENKGTTPPQLFSTVVRSTPATSSVSQHSELLLKPDSQYTPHVDWTYMQLRAGVPLDRCQSELSKHIPPGYVTAVLHAANKRYLWRREFPRPEDKAKYVDLMFGTCTRDEDENAVLSKGLEYFYECTPSESQVIVARTRDSNHRSQFPVDYIASLWPEKAGEIPDTPQKYALAISKLWKGKPYDALVREIAAAIPSMYADQHEPLHIEGQIRKWLEAAATHH